MTDSSATLTHKIDSLVFDCFQKSSDIILQGRRCSVEPEFSSSSQVVPSDFKDNSEYCYQMLRDWKLNLNSPVVIDVSLLNPETKEFYLMERWKIIYKRKDDTKDGRLSSVSRRIVTLMRTLYCFVRLLPGFQLLNMCPTMSILSFRLYNPEQPPSRNFVCESSYYDFPRIQTFRGTLYLGVRYMAANVLQRILQIPQGLLTMPSDALLMQSSQGRGDGSLRTTVPIPIPGMGTPQATQQIYSSSEKVRSKLNSSVVEDIAARTVVDQGTGNDGIGFGNRQKDILNSKQQHTYNPDQVGCRHENAATLISQSRSLDSRPLELQGPHGSIVGQLNPAQLLHREENSNGEDLPKYFLSTPPKHPQRFLYPGSNTRNLGTIHDPQPVEQNIRYNIVPGIGSSVSDSGTSPGGGNPFYLGAATIAGTTSLGLNHREVAGGGQDVRARSSSSSSSTSMGLIGSEADCDGNVGTGVGGASPPYLSFSTQLMSTSPEVGYGFRTLNLSERPQGTMTLYQTPGYRQSLKEDGHQPIDSREQQHNRLICNIKNNHQSSISPENIAISLSLRVVLPRSPFDSSSVSYGNTSCNPASELVLRSRMSSQSQAYLRADTVTDVASPYNWYSEDKERKKVGELDDTTGRRNAFPTFVEEEDLYDGGDQDNDNDEGEEEEEDMPFAWVDHSMSVNRSYNVQSKIGGGAGGREVERERLLAEGKSDSSCPIFSQKSAEYSYNMPPSLVSFPDAPWYESGSAAVVTAISNQLSEYKEFRSTFST